MEKENIFAISIGVLLIFTILFESFLVTTSPGAEILIFVTGKGEVRISAEIANEPQEIQRGLMHRTGLCDSCGMLFVFDDVQQVSFWMKNTLIPLDMIFISEDMKVVNIHENVQPCESDPCSHYS